MKILIVAYELLYYVFKDWHRSFEVKCENQWVFARNEQALLTSWPMI